MTKRDVCWIVAGLAFYALLFVMLGGPGGIS